MTGDIHNNDAPASSPGALPVFDHHYGRPDCWGGLLVDGLVSRPQRYSAARLAALTDRAITDDFRCIEGWTAPGQRWEGVPLRRLLDAAGPLATARYAAVSATDYTVAIALDGDAADNTLLATRLNGEPLPEQHGGPCRLVRRGQECYASIKWVDRIRLTAEPPAATAQRIAMARNRAG